MTAAKGANQKLYQKHDYPGQHEACFQTFQMILVSFLYRVGVYARADVSMSAKSSGT